MEQKEGPKPTFRRPTPPKITPVARPRTSTPQERVEVTRQWWASQDYMKRWWVVALIVSFGWILLALGILALDMEVLRKGKLGPGQEELISERYGMIGGGLFVGTWIVAYLIHRRKKP